MSKQPVPVQKFEEINVDKFTYGPPVPNKLKTITMITMNYNGKRPKIQTPPMKSPFGFSALVDKKKANAEPAFTVELSFDETERSKLFQAWVQQMDDRVMNDTKANSNAWMKRATLSDAIAKELFNPAVKPYKEKNVVSDKWPPRIRFKIQKDRKTGKFSTKVFDHNRQPVDLDAMSLDEIRGFGKNYKMKVIFEVGGVWAGAKGFGTTFRAHQIMLYPLQKLTGFGFVHDVEDDLIFGSINEENEVDADSVEDADPKDADDGKEEEAEPEEVEKEDEPEEGKEDDDGEDQPEEDEPEEEPEEEMVEEEPAPKKKTTRKKAATKQTTLKTKKKAAE